MTPRPRHLVADVLDEQVVDRRGVNAGRVDGIVLVIRKDKPPRVAAIEIGPTELLTRINRRLARWYARLDRRLGADRGQPVRVDWRELSHGQRAVKLPIDVEETPISTLERRLRRVIEHIPGSRA